MYCLTSIFFREKSRSEIIAVLPLKNADYSYFYTLKIPTCPYAKKIKKKKRGDTYNVQSQWTAFAFKKHFFHLEIKQFLTIITANHTIKTHYFLLLLSIQFTIKMPAMHLETLLFMIRHTPMNYLSC